MDSGIPFTRQSVSSRILGCGKLNHEVELPRAIDRGNLLNEAVTTATSYVSFNVTRTTKVLEFTYI